MHSNLCHCSLLMMIVRNSFDQSNGDEDNAEDDNYEAEFKLKLSTPKYSTITSAPSISS